MGKIAGSYLAACPAAVAILDVGYGVFEVLSIFFFKQKTAYEIRNCDWSSDVCSSDLITIPPSLFAITECAGKQVCGL